METSTSNQLEVSTAVAESGPTSLAFQGLWQAGQVFADAGDEAGEGEGGEEESGDEMLGQYEMEDEPNAELSALQTQLAEALTHQVAMQPFGPEYQELARKKVTELRDKIALASKSPTSDFHYKKTTMRQRQAITDLILSLIKRIRTLASGWGVNPLPLLGLLNASLDLQTKGSWNIFQALEKLRSEIANLPYSSGEF
jgi:hypothetical protein